MYKNSLIQRIGKEGIGPVIEFLSSPKLNVELKEALTEEGIFVNGYPCLSLILSWI